MKLVRDNPWIGSWGETFKAFDIFSDRWEAEQVRANYRPMRFLSYAIDAHLSRFLWPDRASVSPAVFHLHTILLHALNALLVFALLRRLFACSGAFAAFLALLWAVHPLQTESVTYVSGRRDVLFFTFYAAALLVHVRGDGELWRFLAVGLLYVGGLLTKEMAVTLPAALVLIDLYGRRTWHRRRIAGYALLACVLGAYVAFKLGMKNPGAGRRTGAGRLRRPR